jgi:hypothetical protein
MIVLDVRKLVADGRRRNKQEELKAKSKLGLKKPITLLLRSTGSWRN